MYSERWITLSPGKRPQEGEGCVNEFMAREVAPSVPETSAPATGTPQRTGFSHDDWLEKIQQLVDCMRQTESERKELTAQLAVVNAEVDRLMSLLAEKQAEQELLKEETAANEQRWEEYRAQLRTLSEG